MWDWAQQRARTARFEALVMPHLDVLHYAALRLAKDHSAADDLVQETFLRAYRAMHQLTHEESCRAWLMKIMTNIWLNQIQKRVREANMLDVYDLEAPEAATNRKQFCEDLDRALQQLPEAFRVVVMLADVEGLSYKEVADALQCPIGTVMSRLYRARQFLRKVLWPHAHPSRNLPPPHS
jgi:RNA polymerase sigma-70 factor (ECF subfamily)